MNEEFWLKNCILYKVMIENVFDWLVLYIMNLSFLFMNICRIWNVEIYSKMNFFILEVWFVVVELMIVLLKLYNR